ncbi:SulA-like leucine-rich domain-containing protein [Ferrimonas senticii]|uniref:SulA-like leucine-rich domain-containing protein n=1 Tax=Ferrimonas senticii TaxID=394566 RepID=UPI00041D0D54|nr:SulA-like leucine-rich domain-containing protein [Ferrimonas senticii]
MKSSQPLQHRHPGIWQTAVAARPSVTQHQCQRGNGLLSIATQLRQQAQQSGWLLLINAPECDWQAVVQQTGFDCSRILRLRCNDELEALMALEQGLITGTSVAVAAWLPQLDARDQRRLQLISKRAHCPAFVFHSDPQRLCAIANSLH